MTPIGLDVGRIPKLTVHFNLKSPELAICEVRLLPAISNDAGRVKSFFKFFYFAYH